MAQKKVTIEPWKFVDFAEEKPAANKSLYIEI